MAHILLLAHVKEFLQLIILQMEFLNLQQLGYILLYHLYQILPSFLSQLYYYHSIQIRLFLELHKQKHYILLELAYNSNPRSNLKCKYIIGVIVLIIAFAPKDSPAITFTVILSSLLVPIGIFD